MLQIWYKTFVRPGDTLCTMRLIDLSHPIESGTSAYPGLPQPEIVPHAPRALFQIDRISMVGNTGTYIDAPFHFFPDGADMGSLELMRIADIDGIVVSIDPGIRAIERGHLPSKLPSGGCVLFHTGWDRHWNTRGYALNAPFVSAGAAAALAESGVALVGIDSINIDDTGDPTRPAHTTLLAHGATIVEHLRNVGALRGKAFRFFAVPPAVRGMGSFPVRAFALI